VSHQPERKEKNCLNCGATVVGRYCHVCGQENVEIKESFWSLAKHFVFDLFHFDGKFFHTLKYIFIRPGLVAKEYCHGKRASFLHPIRMYLFTSAVFFLIFFSFNSIGSGKKYPADKLTEKDRTEALDDYRERLRKNRNDTSAQKIVALLSDTTKEVSGDEILASDSKGFFTITGNSYSNVQQYDSAQKALPSGKRDGWFRQLLARKALIFNQKYKERPDEASKIFWESFVHRLPYMLFLSLPFFALILQILYRRRKNFYYSDHAVFTIYHYILSFILLLIVFGFTTLQQKVGWGFLAYVIPVFFLAWPVYLWLEMRNFYAQGGFKTTVKFVVLNLLGLFVIFLLFLIFLIFSIFEL
jgi:hypothetical protein